MDPFNYTVELKGAHNSVETFADVKEFILFSNKNDCTKLFNEVTFFLEYNGAKVKFSTAVDKKLFRKINYFQKVKENLGAYTMLLTLETLAVSDDITNNLKKARYSVLHYIAGDFAIDFDLAIKIKNVR